MTDERALVARLSLGEKVSLLSGRDHWTLPALPAIGLEAIKMSDGPTGVKGGDEHPDGPTVPCGTALAATWAPDLVEEVGALLGEAARAAGVHVLLAPATNMLRSPLGGRTFEYYGEDPALAAAITSAYIRGVQSCGVAATVKHFVCNEVESSRMTASVEIDEQALRELYLRPFESAVCDADVWAVMCSYNKLGGTYMSAHPLLDELLRVEWGFTGVVVSDWGAVHDTVPSAQSGLDIEMPGPPSHRGEKLVAAARSGEVPEEMIDEKVVRVLRLARRTGALGGSVAPRRTSDAPGLLRRAAAESFVLLKNDGDLLPLAPDTKIAVLGPLAAVSPLQGGGSANVGPIAGASPLDGIRAHADVRYEPGYVPSALPRLDLTWVGEAGFTVEFRDEKGELVDVHTERTDRFVFRSVVAGRRLADLVVRLRATLTPPDDGEYVFAVNCAGVGTLRIDGEEVLALDAAHELDWSYLYRPESRGLARVTLERGKPVRFELDYEMTPGPSGEAGLVTLRARPPQAQDLLARGVDAAREADVAIVVAGLGEEHESEGWDRTTLELPAEQTELIAAVAAANPRTVVVLSVGAPVLVDWADDLPALLLAWYGGQALGSALGEVLTGSAEPGGRLPVTFPARPQDVPVLDPAPDDGASWHYREGVFVGYRHFDRHGLEPAYCFGHGLGYTRFAYEELRVERNGDEVDVVVRVRNCGERRGKEVVQVYVGCEDAGRPLRELRAFRPVELDAGADAEVAFTLGERAFSAWHDAAGRFVVVPGRREIAVGSSSRNLPLRESVGFAAELVPEGGAV